jgi:hypothetical protein
MGRSLWREDGSVFYNCCCLRQRSHSQVRVPRGLWPHFTVSDLRLPEPGGPGPCIYIPQEQGGLVIPPGTGFWLPYKRPSVSLLWPLGTDRTENTALLLLRAFVSAETCLINRSTATNVRVTSRIVTIPLLLICGHYLAAAVSNSTVLALSKWATLRPRKWMPS